MLREQEEWLTANCLDFLDCEVGLKKHSYSRQCCLQHTMIRMMKKTKKGQLSLRELWIREARDRLAMKKAGERISSYKEVIKRKASLEETVQEK